MLKFLIILLLCVSFPISVFAYSGVNLWNQVQTLCNIQSGDPLYPSTQRLGIYNASVRFIDQMEIAVEKIDTISLYVNTTEYDLEGDYVLSGYLHPTDIRTIKWYDNTPTYQQDFEFLDKIRVSDVNKVASGLSSSPNYFYFWGSICGVVPKPQGGNVAIYWSAVHKTINSESGLFWAKARYRPSLLFVASSYYKQREQNEAGYSNLLQIGQSMLIDIAQIEQMIRNSKDIILLPEIYSE